MKSKVSGRERGKAVFLERDALGVSKPIDNKEEFSSTIKFTYARSLENSGSFYLGYPIEAGYEDNCVVNDIVKNFFIGRTSSAGAIRMDPNFSQRGHREFFIDSIGKLRIAFCDIVKVYHAKDECIKRQTRSYSERRHPHGQNLEKLKQSIAENWFFRNFFTCQTDFT